jgi:fermentation-respiration switch protein FrsA (DUF1100 family)
MTRKLRPIPILIQQGGRDALTPLGDAELLHSDLAAGHNANAQLKIYPTLQHNFVPTAKLDELVPDGAVDEIFLDELASFAAAHLARH